MELFQKSNLDSPFDITKTSAKMNLSEVFREKKGSYLNEFTLYMAHFNAIPNYINEIEIDEKYRKATTKGLKINDSLEKTIELYGPPRMKSAKGAIWNRFSILMRDRVNEIMLIRLKIRD